MNDVLVSIVLATKNSLGMLKGAMTSLRNQTYKNFEVVVIDGQSTDGTRQYLEQLELNIRLISEPDDGISDAYAKGLRHAHGDIVGILSTDERYYPHSLARAVQWFAEDESRLVCGGSCKFLNADGIEVDSYQDDYLDLERHLACKHVCSISASFFNRKLLGGELYYSAFRKTCPDYEFWARLALKYDRSRFVWFSEPTIQAYRTEISTSFRDDAFRQIVEDKIAYLRQFIMENQCERLAEVDVNHCAAGIHTWAAEQLSYINYRSPDILYHCREAFALNSDCPRLMAVIRRHPLLDLAGGSVVAVADSPGDIVKDEKVLTAASLSLCHDARLEDDEHFCLVSASAPWIYSFALPLASLGLTNLLSDLDTTLWLAVDIEVIRGEFGIGMLMQDGKHEGERVIKPSYGRQCLFLKINPVSQKSLLIRSGGEGASWARLYKLAVVSAGSD